MKKLFILLLISAHLAAFEDVFFESTLSHTEGKGIGYRKGYTTLDFFLMSKPFFLDIRGHGFNNRKLAANLGTGLRYHTFCDSVVGINAYYDMRQGDHRNFDQVGHIFHQVGIGLEYLTPDWEVRLNLYQPVGKKSWRFQQVIFLDHAGFIPTFLEKRQFTMKGFDAELGGYIGQGNFNCCIPWRTYLSFGPYCYQQHEKGARWGVHSRFALELGELLSFEIRCSYDRITQTACQVRVNLTFPLYPLTSISRTYDEDFCFWGSMLEVLTRPVQRAEIIPLRTQRLFLDD